MRATRLAFGAATAPAVALLLGACALVGGRDPLVESGAALYERHCAACHGAEGRGDGPVAPVLRFEPPDLTRLAERNGGRFPEESLGETIEGRFQPGSHGLPTMPVWGRPLAGPLATKASGEDGARGRIAAILAYLRTLQSEAPSD